MSLNLGGDGVITGCTSLAEPALTLSGLTVDTDTLVVDSANDYVGINTSTPSGVLNVKTNTAAGPSLTYDSANILNLDYGTVQLAAGIDPSSPFGSYLQSRDNSNGSRTLNLNPAGGNIGIGTTNPVVALDVSGEVRASTGVLFGTDTAAANTLDDYEEGTWVPSVAGSTTVGTATYSQQHGSYEKIGRQVTLRGYVAWSSATGTGSLEIRGLPFISFAGTFAYIQPGSLMVNQIVYPAGYTQANIYMANGSTAMNVFLSGSNQPYIAESVEAAGALIFSITYTTPQYHLSKN